MFLIEKPVVCKSKYWNSTVFAKNVLGKF